MTIKLSKKTVAESLYDLQYFLIGMCAAFDMTHEEGVRFITGAASERLKEISKVNVLTKDIQYNIDQGGERIIKVDGDERWLVWSHDYSQLCNYYLDDYNIYRTSYCESDRNKHTDVVCHCYDGLGKVVLNAEEIPVILRSPIHSMLSE